MKDIQEKIGVRTFTLEDQQIFAELSGDYNPIHLDSLNARRMLYGSIVVHGIHALLWSLDTLLQKHTHKRTYKICELQVDFLKAIPLDEELRLSSNTNTKGLSTLSLWVHEARYMQIKIQLHESTEEHIDNFVPRSPPYESPRFYSAQKLIDAHGTLDLFLDVGRARTLFPDLLRSISATPLACILATTRLVGTRCPGHDSIYSRLSLTQDSTLYESKLQYRVKDVDLRFGLLHIDLKAPQLQGEIRAFIRPKVEEQKSFQKLKELVDPMEFTGQRALIVGGSRGIGETTAKLLASGGAKVYLSYSRGIDEAQKIISEIRTGGGEAEAFHLNVLDAYDENTERFISEKAPSHVYYFATPYIFSGTKGVFCEQLFKRFCSYYLNSFLKIVCSLNEIGTNNFFYPSSVAVESHPLHLLEYSAAKAAGEILCSYLNKSYNINMYYPRLPRLHSDQTKSFYPTHTEDTGPIMVNHLRLFSRDST